MTRLLYDAIWGDYCDWYLELAKLGLAADASAERRTTTWRTLTWVLDRYLRLLHPIMPHVTEEIWSRMPHLTTDPELLIVARWPTDVRRRRSEPDAHVADGVAQLIDLVTAIRAARAESGVDATAWLEAKIWLPAGPARDAYSQMEQAVEQTGANQARAGGSNGWISQTAAASAVAVISSVGEAQAAAFRSRMRDREQRAA